MFHLKGYKNKCLNSIGTKDSTEIEDGMTMLTLQTSINQSLDSVNSCPNSMLKSPLLKPLHEYARILSLKFPKICCLRRHYFVKGSYCSLYLLQVINPLSSALSLRLYLLAQCLPSSET